MIPRVHAMTVANDDTTIQMIGRASRRLIVIAPGLSIPVAKALAEQWSRLAPDAVSVALDVDPEVCRLGFGHIDAVKLLGHTAAHLRTTLNVHPGLRIGVVIADDETLIFSPTPLNIEASPSMDKGGAIRPNAIRLGQPPDGLARDVGAGPDGVKDQIIGLDSATQSRISEVDADLKARPPQQIEISRLLRVYTAYLEFVELRLVGCMLERRTIQIPSDLIGIADEKTRKLLESKFRLIDAHDAGVWGEELRRIKEFIVRKFLVHLPTFGFVIRVADKQGFELALKTLRKMLNRARDRKNQSLQAAIDRRVASLYQALLPAVTTAPPARWGARLKARGPDLLLHDELQALAGTAQEMLEEARVEVRYKGVTYDTLQDPAFVNAVRKALPDMGRLHDELSVAPALPGPRRTG